MTACIVGWAHTTFGKLDNETVESLIVRVADEALDHAGVEARDVDEIVLGHFNAGFSPQDFTASLVLQANESFRFKPATRVENACATGSAAVHQAIKTIEAKRARIVLVVGVEQMTRTPGPEIGRNLLKASYLPEDGETPGGFAGVFGKIAGAYFQRHGDQSDALAHDRREEPQERGREPLSRRCARTSASSSAGAESEKNPFVAGPLKRTDCSLVSDGAAALVIDRYRDRAADEARRRLPGVAPMPRTSCRCRSATSCVSRAAPKRGGRRSRRRGIELADLSFVETHDCFTIAELIEYEAMGLTPEGQGATAIKEGWTQKDGRLPVNPSGGLKAKGHPIGATGVSMHALTAMQLCGDAGDMQIAEPAARRHLQHGRRGGRELCERARADQVTSSPATRSSRTARSDNDGDHSPGALAWIASACRPRSKAPASAALTTRWRSTRLFPSKAGDTTSMRKWVSPPSRQPAWPRCCWDSSSTTRRVGSSRSRSVAVIQSLRLICASSPIRLP